ncbi:Transcription factor/CCAAT displacement protein CDP1 [Phaffia rhodozyma]|uniref:Protein CASP n=1 Tax=Phaffia rhodozyma TaxID=264483 RepID=A0A0F7SN10_PHARH|nr:Transcription factor/CCAAT displacement protein CDP1 [Phaffia rhodozyma]
MADFSTALSTWRDINLTDLQKSLDTTALELVENQKENVVGRKKLAEQTREFKKIPTDAEKLESIKSLLKAYQSEIDQLTRRSKVAENAFLNAYKLLAEAPDPYPLLDAAVDQTVKVAEAQVLESELGRLREENQELKKQVGEIAGAEEKRKKAENKVDALEAKMEELIQERVTQKENELNATYDERMRNYEEREQDLNNQLRTTKSQLTDLRTTSDSTQARLIKASQQQDNEVVGRMSELDMLMGDLERANGRVGSVERRNEILRAEIESVKSGSQYAERVKQLESQVSELESESTRLLRALDLEKDSRSSSEKTLRKKIEDLNKEIGLKAAEIEHLRQRAKEYTDYDEIKRELEIMKYVEFGDVDLSEDLENRNEIQLPNPNAAKNNKIKKEGESLEEMLIRKNRKVLDELTKLRVSQEESSGATTELEQMLQTVQAELERQKKLNERLENDLLQINKPNGGAVKTSVSDAHSGSNEAGSAVGGAKSGGLEGLEIGTGSDKTRASPVPFQSGSSDNSILPIVTSQRDRFRARNAELEEELRKQFESISELRTEIKSLQADNLKLYEKVRYMGSYREDSSAVAGPSSYYSGNSSSNLRTGSGGGLGNLGISGLAGGRGDEIGKYKDKYEDSINPFESFKSREAQRAIQALNPIERAVFALCRGIIGNRRARSIFVLYAALLHLLVILSLWGSLASGGGVDISDPVQMPPLRR